ncbi:MAG: hypothetical protein KDD99_30595, partial [Bacteroidetes bacterium]|nr:hypothetical protein [Bacteroidota bacterium]
MSISILDQNIIAQESDCHCQNNNKRFEYHISFKNDKYVTICRNDLLPFILNLRNISLKSSYSEGKGNYFRLTGWYILDLVSGNIAFDIG